MMYFAVFYASFFKSYNVVIFFVDVFPHLPGEGC